MKGYHIKRMDQKGFTLIEIIVSLVLVGVMAVTAGVGIVTFVKGQTFTLVNAALTQKAELAISRITWEFMELTDVLSINAEGNYLAYHMIDNDSAIGLDTTDNQLKITEGAMALTDGYPLVDNVESFSMSLWTLDESGNKIAWSVGDSAMLYGIDVELKLIHPDEDVGALTFETSVNPRNNG